MPRHARTRARTHTHTYETNLHVPQKRWYPPNSIYCYMPEKHKTAWIHPTFSMNHIYLKSVSVWEMEKYILLNNLALSVPYIADKSYLIKINLFLWLEDLPNQAWLDNQDVWDSPTQFDRIFNFRKPPRVQFSFSYTLKDLVAHCTASDFSEGHNEIEKRDKKVGLCLLAETYRPLYKVTNGQKWLLHGCICNCDLRIRNKGELKQKKQERQKQIGSICTPPHRVKLSFEISVMRHDGTQRKESSDVQGETRETKRGSIRHTRSSQKGPLWIAM
jgi:hypothetical protein